MNPKVRKNKDKESTPQNKQIDFEESIKVQTKGNESKESGSVKKSGQKKNETTKIKAGVEVKVEVDIDKKGDIPQMIEKFQNNPEIREIETQLAQAIQKDTIEQSLNEGGQSRSKEEEERQNSEGQKHYVIPGSVVEGQFQKIKKEMKEPEVEKDIQKVQKQKKEEGVDSKQIDKEKSSEFQDLEETTELSKRQKQLKEHPEKLHYIIPGTMYEGQFEYVTKEKKEEEVEKLLEELQNEKRDIQISTQHYVNPTTVVQGQVKKGVKQQKKEEVEKELQKKDQVNKLENIGQISAVLNPKVLTRTNLHEFKSTEVPQLHQQDIPLQFQPDEMFVNLFESTESPQIQPIKSLEPVKIGFKNQDELGLKPLMINLIDEPKEEQRHYVIPGTMFEGQFQYVTKQKKEEDVEDQLAQLEYEKHELEMNTEHYVNPSTIVEGIVSFDRKTQKEKPSQSSNAQATVKNQQVPRLQEPEQSKPDQIQNPNVIQKVNLHEFKSTEVPKYHQQHIPLQHKPDRINVNLFEATKEFEKENQQEASPQKSFQKSAPQELRQKQNDASPRRLIQQDESPLRSNSKKQSPARSDISAKERLTDFSKIEPEEMKLVKERRFKDGVTKLEIISNIDRTVPLKIDPITTMTVVSSTDQQRPSILIPEYEERFDDVEVMFFEASLNKEASSPKDLVNMRAKHVFEPSEFPDFLQNMKNRDGSPVKVMIGTKQFSNYPGQIIPSPPIIDQQTLQELRKQGQDEIILKKVQIEPTTEQKVQKPETQSIEPTVTITNNNLQTVEVQQIRENEGNRTKMQLREQTTEILRGNQKVQMEHIQGTFQIDRVKKTNTNDDKEKPFFPKLIRSVLFSSAVGGLAWLGSQDRKVTAATALAGLTLALLVQK